MTVVSLYARVSSKKQAQENTIESQIAELEQRISNDRYELLDEYKFIDNGYSGSNLERPGLESLRDKVSEGKIDKIYVHSPDRLSRKAAYQAILLEEFRKTGSEVVFLNHKFEDNPESNMYLGMQGLIAEYERAKILERNRRGKLHSARKGSISVMAKAPYGYHYIKKSVGEWQARFEINEEEAAVVRKIFSWICEERVTIRAVAHRLNTIPIITQTGKNYWRASTVCQILKNPAYIGQAAFGKRKVGPRLLTTRSERRKNYSTYDTSKENWIYIAVPRIISEDLFNTVQEQLDENRKRSRARRRSGTFLLQGLIVCQRCTHAYCVTHGHNTTNSQNGEKLLYYYYRCNGAYSSKVNGKKSCDNKGIRTDVLDTAVWEEVKDLLKEPDRVVNEYQRRLVGDKGSLTNQTLEKQENKLKRSITKLIDGYTQEYITISVESGIKRR